MYMYTNKYVYPLNTMYTNIHIYICIYLSQQHNDNTSRCVLKHSIIQIQITITLKEHITEQLYSTNKKNNNNIMGDI